MRSQVCVGELRAVNRCNFCAIQPQNKSTVSSSLLLCLLVLKKDLWIYFHDDVTANGIIKGKQTFTLFPNKHLQPRYKDSNISHIPQSPARHTRPEKGVGSVTTHSTGASNSEAKPPFSPLQKGITLLTTAVPSDRENQP